MNRQRCKRCGALVNMTIDRVIKGRRTILCLQCAIEDDQLPKNHVKVIEPENDNQMTLFDQDEE